jgi:hypothetical protein
MGISHLASGYQTTEGVPRTALELFERLFQAREPRLQQATILLLLPYPQLAQAAQSAIDQLPRGAHDLARRRYVASAAMQRMARTRIAQSRGPQPLIPPTYLVQLGLPSVNEEFGRATRLELARREQDLYGYDAWGTCLTVLDLFLSEIRRRDWGNTCDNGQTKET